MEHKIWPRLLSERVHITLVGCGGNGSQMLTGLARLHAALRALDHPGLRVVAWDPDGVSPANVGRQLFSPGDVGQNKATVLVHRLNSFFGIAWYAEPSEFGVRAWHARTDIVISCVDTRAAREAIRYCVESMGTHPRYWLDLGNRAADGQMVLGEPAGSKRFRQKRDRLPVVTELFPEIRNSRIKEDNTPSCSLAEALQRQELFINQLVVTQALQLLWQLLRHGKTDWHGAFINAATGRVTPLPIDREAWARFGFHHYRVPKKKGHKHESHARKH
jgi:PRTRC genetic system ThiF family protein